MRNPDPAHHHLYGEFATRLSAAGGHALVAGSADDVVGVVNEIPGVNVSGAAWISEPVEAEFPHILARIRKRGIAASVPESPDAVRDAPLGISVARLAIAETGSVLLHENDLASRSVSLMTRHLIVLCPMTSLVASLDDASPVLREIATTGASYATFVTGPSRTADIERELAVGVQGPGTVHVIFLTEVPAPGGSGDY